jgi:hypothetical protein
MICNAANVLRELFDHSKDALSDDKLAWARNLLDHAESESENLAGTLETLAVSFSSLDKQFVGNETIASILWGLSNQANTIAVMVNIDQEAEYLAGTRKAAKQQ